MMRVVALLLCGVLAVHGNSDGAPAMACSVTAPEFLAATTMCSNRPNRNANLSLALPAAFVPGAADALPIALSGSIATIKGVLLTASAGALAPPSTSPFASSFVLASHACVHRRVCQSASDAAARQLRYCRRHTPLRRRQAARRAHTSPLAAAARRRGPGHGDVSRAAGAAAQCRRHVRCACS